MVVIQWSTEDNSNQNSTYVCSHFQFLCQGSDHSYVITGTVKAALLLNLCNCRFFSDVQELHSHWLLPLLPGTHLTVLFMFFEILLLKVETVSSPLLSNLQFNIVA